MNLDKKKSSILIIYTGGTIGMAKDYGTNSLKPFDFDNIYELIPELKNFVKNLDTISLKNMMVLLFYTEQILCLLQLRL